MTERKYVLYWMVAHRRLTWNFALQNAVSWCRRLSLPLVIFEPLRCDYRWASDRLHWFFVQGMQDHGKALKNQAAVYFPYLEPQPGAGRGLLAALANDAALVVTDDYPCIFVPQMIQSAAEKINCRLEAVDSNGILPIRLADKTFARAVDFRRFMHRTACAQLAELPLADPMSELPPTPPATLRAEILDRWPAARVESMQPSDLLSYPIDHSVAPVAAVGGPSAGQRQMQNFLTGKLREYETQRRNVDQVGTSQLSP
jgi:deoxyribodipyrimidine photo-lyase